MLQYLVFVFFTYTPMLLRVSSYLESYTFRETQTLQNKPFWLETHSLAACWYFASLDHFCCLHQQQSHQHLISIANENKCQHLSSFIRFALYALVIIWLQHAQAVCCLVVASKLICLGMKSFKRSMACLLTEVI